MISASCLLEETYLISVNTACAELHIQSGQEAGQTSLIFHKLHRSCYDSAVGAIRQFYISGVVKDSNCTPLSLLSVLIYRKG